MAQKKRQKKQYVVEEGIFGIYPDFPVLINDNVVISKEEKPLHFHYYLEIGCCLEGNYLFSSNHKKYVVKEKGITITGPNILHMVQNKNIEETAKAVYIYIDLEDLLKMFPVGEAKNQLIFVKEALHDILYLSGEKHPDIIWIINEIIYLYKSGKGNYKNYKMQIIGLIYTAFLKMYDIFSEKIGQNIDKKDLPIMPAIEYIYNHYMDQIKVAELAQTCHFSESYFRRVFQEMKGMSPMDYLNSIRIREAAIMLINTTDNIRLIGEKCGYPSVTTFERNFRQRMGMLPSEWRESQKNPRKKDRKIHSIKRTYS